MAGTGPASTGIQMRAARRQPSDIVIQMFSISRTPVGKMDSWGIDGTVGIVNTQLEGTAAAAGRREGPTADAANLWTGAGKSMIGCSCSPRSRSA
jgi:hypothetical protein